jgi:hypothetical protein
MRAAALLCSVEAFGPGLQGPGLQARAIGVLSGRSSAGDPLERAKLLTFLLGALLDPELQPRSSIDDPVFIFGSLDCASTALARLPPGTHTDFRIRFSSLEKSLQ